MHPQGHHAATEMVSAGHHHADGDNYKLPWIWESSDRHREAQSEYVAIKKDCRAPYPTCISSPQHQQRLVLRNRFQAKVDVIRLRFPSSSSQSSCWLPRSHPLPCVGFSAHLTSSYWQHNISRKITPLKKKKKEKMFSASLEPLWVTKRRREQGRHSLSSSQIACSVAGSSEESWQKQQVHWGAAGVSPTYGWVPRFA